MKTVKNIDMATMPLRRGHARVVVVSLMGQLIGQGLATLVGIIIPMMQITLHPELSADMQGLMGCISLIGITLGTVVIGHLSDRFGYLMFFRLCPAMIAATSVVAYFFHDTTTLMACLFVMGFSIGGEYSLDSDYISETMPHRWKVFMVGVAKAAASLGSVIVAVACYFMIDSWHAASPWPRLLFIITGLAGVTLLMRLNFVQSPEWLMSRGRKAQAEAAVQKLLGSDVVMDVPPRPSTAPAADNESMWQFVKRNAARIVFSGVPWACEGLGVYGIGIFLPILIMALGLEHIPADAPRIDHVISSVEMTIWLSIIMVVGFAAGLAVLRRLYHVKMQAWGFMLCAAGLVVLLLAYRLHWPTWIAIAGFMAFELFLNAGPHLITFILPSQIYPVADRGTGAGIAAGVGKVGAVAGAFFIPMLLKWGGSTLVLVVSAAVMVVGGIVTAVIGPKVLPRSADK